jgi:beta-xylosidase
MHEAKGWIDPCPLWDEDGKAYLVHAFAGSRSGLKSVLVVHEMEPDGSALLGEGKLIYDGHGVNRTIEGPKFYKRNGYYYIFAPAGGVKPGWQTVLRSKDPFGPYEIRTVMHQGSTDINGPHQGGWVELENGESWFIHFQDMDAYGRIVHLNPVSWQEDDWPIIGIDLDGDGIGEPVREHAKPSIEVKAEPFGPQTSDEFNWTSLGQQWQWHANPEQEWMFNSGNLGFIRMYCVPLPEGHKNHWETPHLLLQKLPAPVFSATAKVAFHAQQDGDRTGLIVMGMSYASLVLEKSDGKLLLSQILCDDAEHGGEEKTMESIQAKSSIVYLKVNVSEGAVCTFSYSFDGKRYKKLGQEFKAVAGKWIGTKVGLFASSTEKTNDSGYADFDWFMIK